MPATGDRAGLRGVYEGGCPHRPRVTLDPGQAFPACTGCYRAVAWSLVAPLPPLPPGEEGTGPRAPSPARGRRPARGRGAALRLGLGGLLLLPGAAAAGVLPGSPPGFETGVLRLKLVGAGGEPAAAPYFDVGAARPGMAPARAVVGVENTGTLPATFRLSASVSRAAPGPSLDEVLVAEVREAGSGALLYRGPVSGLRVEGGPLAPGEGARYRVGVGWPPGPRDARYQGRSLRAALRLEARAVGTPTAPG